MNDLTLQSFTGTGEDFFFHSDTIRIDEEDKTVWLIRDGEKIFIHTQWKNLQAVLDANAAEAAEFNSSGKLNDLVKVATIPNGVYYDWKSKGYTDDPVKMARLLNDGDHSKFRTNGLVI